MDVIFYYNASDARTINKEIIEGETFQGAVLSEVELEEPVIRFESEGVLKYNYAYIPALKRYYSINKRTCYRDGIWDVYFNIDVLMSFRGDIYQLYAVVDKQKMDINGDEYIDDGSLVSDNIMFTTVYNFPSGFNNTPEYILITAG